MKDWWKQLKKDKRPKTIQSRLKEMKEVDDDILSCQAAKEMMEYQLVLEILKRKDAVDLLKPRYSLLRKLEK